jgi:hypothetical protein
MSMYSEAAKRVAEANKANAMQKTAGINKDRLTSFGQRYGYQQAFKRLSPEGRQALSKAASVLNGGGMDVALDMLGNGIPGARSALIRERYLNAPDQLLGGLTPDEAFSITIDHFDSAAIAMQNLFLIRMSSSSGNDLVQFNTFAIDLEYAPYTIGGDKVKIGGAVMDRVTGNEAVELRMTVMDDRAGSIKAWFAGQCEIVASYDGTVGLPADYRVRIEVVHAFVADKYHDIAGNPQADAFYQDGGWFRPANMDVSLSREESGAQRLPLTFAQLDTFVV